MTRIILSPFLAVITVLLIPSIDKVLLFLPLIFALSVSTVNFRKLKIHNHYLGVILTVLQSYAVFLALAVVLFFLDEFLQDTSGEAPWISIILVTTGGYCAAMLLFYFFMYVFNVDNKRFSFFAITVCYTLIIIVMQVFSKNEFLQFGVEKFTSFLISWIIFMSLAFSLALNRTELMRFLDRRGKLEEGS